MSSCTYTENVAGDQLERLISVIQSRLLVLCILTNDNISDFFKAVSEVLIKDNKTPKVLREVGPFMQNMNMT